MSEPIECTSDDGITIALIEGVIATFRVLATRDLSSRAVQDAITDLSRDLCVNDIMHDPAYKLIRETAEIFRARAGIHEGEGK